ncbi:MAG TPA: recombinase family protein, partial [Rhizomicrobium sp.]|nr:recombinase family protein [Rhizomicrobium sp.]
MNKLLRCAVYTRKSTDEGLDQAFNSLHAQREACEAYILSQKAEGWKLLAIAYDDGGFSGGTMERPALKRLMADVEAARIDIVVVYKVDRLTRSLSDFARIVDVLDKAASSFVSVTQAFNTTTSMGRLTLNVLLSFAQFEREVTGERIRDKIAASKKKGMWMGGSLPFGYDTPNDLTTRALVINPPEADLVRRIFTRYHQDGSVHRLMRWLNDQGYRTKITTSRKGHTRGGVPFGRGALLHLLKNRHYLGEIVHKAVSYPGAHPAIIDSALFAAVQARIASNRRERRPRSVQAG